MMDSVKDVPVLEVHSTDEEEEVVACRWLWRFFSPFSLKHSNKVIIIPAMPKFFHYNLLKVTS